MSYVKQFGSDRPQKLPFHLVDQNREAFTQKSSFLVIFFWLVIFLCCLSAFNREENVFFGYVHFINIECCILSIRTHGSQVICAKCTEMGVIWLFFLCGFVYMQIVKQVAGQQGLYFECLEALGR